MTPVTPPMPQVVAEDDPRLKELQSVKTGRKRTDSPYLGFVTSAPRGQWLVVEATKEFPTDKVAREVRRAVAQYNDDNKSEDGSTLKVATKPRENRVWMTFTLTVPETEEAAPATETATETPEGEAPAADAPADAPAADAPADAPTADAAPETAPETPTETPAPRSTRKR